MTTLTGEEKNISECKSVYELVEKLQWRIESLENEHMLLLDRNQQTQVRNF